MSLISYKFTQRELNDYYLPKADAFRYMIDSVNANGFGQIIQRTSVAGDVVDTYYQIFDYATNSMVVYNPTMGQTVPSEEAGPTFWGVSSLEGLGFLNGFTSIENLRKLKYCNNCTDSNALTVPVITNFKQRFEQLNSLTRTYNLFDGFLFYDTAQPRFTNVYPSVKYDDGVNISYFFKTVDGTDKTLTQMSEITGDLPSQIETSIDTAPVFRPKEGVNSVITSCCDGFSQIIFGQYAQGTILYNGTLENSYCWYVESLTNDPVTVPPAVQFTSGGRSCQFCITTHGCPPICELISLTYSTNAADVCSQVYNDYFIAWNVGKIYNFEDCGGLSPAAGYYADGKFIYYWDGLSISDYGPCQTCDVLSLSFSLNDGVGICYLPQSQYMLDPSSNLLYENESCGGTLAPTGFYSDGVEIYFSNEFGFKNLGKICSTTYILEYCCTGEQRILDNQGKEMPVGSLVYFLADDPNYPVPCWRVIGQTFATANITGLVTGGIYLDCIDCQTSTGISCGG